MVKIDGVWKVEKVSELSENIIFYTKNEEGKYEVPSITIFAGKYNVASKKLSNINKIYRINGNGKDGNLEEEMEPILKNKLEELKNNGEIASFSVDYFQRLLGVSEYLTSIRKKNSSNMPLSKMELSFLYGAYEVKNGPNYREPEKVYAYEYATFGSSVDPRFLEIIESRNQQEDFERLDPEEKVILLGRTDYTYDVKEEDDKVIIAAEALRYASDELLKNTKFIRRYMSRSSYRASILKYSAPNINSNKKLVMDVLKTKLNDDYKYIDPKIMDDKELILMLIQRYSDSVRYIGEEILEKYPELNMLADYKKSFEILSLINEYFCLVDNKMVDSKRMEMISQKLLELMEHAPLKIRNDFYIMLRASMINSEVLNYVNSDVKMQIKSR